MSHWIEYAEECGHILSQCRCPGPKESRHSPGLCHKCRAIQEQRLAGTSTELAVAPAAPESLVARLVQAIGAYGAEAASTGQLAPSGELADLLRAVDDLEADMRSWRDCACEVQAVLLAYIGGTDPRCSGGARELAENAVAVAHERCCYAERAGALRGALHAHELSVKLVRSIAHSWRDAAPPLECRKEFQDTAGRIEACARSLEDNVDFLEANLLEDLFPSSPVKLTHE